MHPDPPLPPIRRGWRTTEFWSHLALNVAVLVAALEKALPPKYAAIAAAISSAGYAVSRGAAKREVA